MLERAEHGSRGLVHRHSSLVERVQGCSGLRTTAQGQQPQWWRVSRRCWLQQRGNRALVKIR
jgi:hypothetical protein